MHLRGIFFFLIFTTVAAHAGVVQSNMRVCGTTTHYREFGADAPAIRGSNGLELEDEVFRIKGFATLDRTSNVAEFLSAVEIEGVWICANGELETVSKREKFVYNFYPRSFELLETKDSYLSPNDVVGFYSGVSAYRGKKYAATLWVSERTDLLFETRVFAQSVVNLATSTFQIYCPWSNTSDPLLPEKASGFRLCRVDKDSLATTITMNCDAQTKMKLSMSFMRTAQAGRAPSVNLHIVLEHPAKGRVLQVDLARVGKPLQF